MPDLILSVSDFVAVLNQTLEFAYPSVTIVGELSNLRVSKNKWVYFDLKDDFSSVKFFGTVYQLPGPLEDGMTVQVRGAPRLHQLYGFSVTAQSIMPVGEGSIKKAAELLASKLEAEGLFAPDRKRVIPYPPTTIGLIGSGESAAYHDFMKILNQRWVGIDVRLADVQVQGEAAIAQVVAAIEYFNSHAEPVDVLVITRGGGSADDLAVFSTEQVTRAVAASRIPTVVAIGHEVDISLSELAADLRASTPSNAAELLTPDKKQEREVVRSMAKQLQQALLGTVTYQKQQLELQKQDLSEALERMLHDLGQTLGLQSKLLEALSPNAALARGYAIVSDGKHTVRSIKQLKMGQTIFIRLQDGAIKTQVTDENASIL